MRKSRHTQWFGWSVLIGLIAAGPAQGSPLDGGLLEVAFDAGALDAGGPSENALSADGGVATSDGGVALVDDPTKLSRFDVGAVPIVNYVSQLGFGFGANIGFYWRKPGHRPYEYALIAQAYFTTGGLQSHYLRFDAPNFQGTGLRPKVDVGFVRDLFRTFYGVGNTIDRPWSPPGLSGSSIDFASAAQRYCLVTTDARCSAQTPDPSLGSEYYSYDFWVFYLHLLLEGRFTPQLWWGVKLALTRTQAAVRPGSFLNEWQQDPNLNPRLAGLDSQFQAEAVGEITLDTRDIEASPTRGWLINAAMRLGLDPIAGKPWVGGSLSARGFYSPFNLGSYLVLAGRVLFDIVEGDVPFFYMSSIATRVRVSELLGGPYSIRGMLRTKYIGREKLLIDLELRSRVLRLRPFDRTLDIWLVAFADAGRVWADLRDPNPAPWNLHYSVGGGLRLAWVTDYVVRADFGFSEGFRAFILVFEQHF